MICIFETLSGCGTNNGDTEVAATTTAEVIRLCLFETVRFYDKINLDYWVIMPNHIHLIVSFDRNNSVSLSGFVKSFKLQSQAQGNNWITIIHQLILRTL